MSHTKRWAREFELGLEELWRGRRQGFSGNRRASRRGPASVGGLLDQLLVGQSLTVSWKEKKAVVELEETLRCTCCGEPLTELRLSSLCPMFAACPCCGDPPSA